MRTFTIQMTEQQLAIIHKALKLAKSVDNDDPMLNASDREELEALVDMSDPAQPELYPSTTGLNGWAL